MSYGRGRYTRGRFGAARTSYSGQSAAGNSRLWMRKKPFNKRVYRRKLFNASSDATKYRTIFSLTGTNTTPVSMSRARVTTRAAILQDFFLISGGSTEASFVTTANLKDKIFVRGGTMRFTLTNDPGDAENLVPIRVRVWFGWMRETNFPAFEAVFGNPDVSSIWDPTIVPDWQRYFKISDYCEKILLISDSLGWEKRVRPFQFDTSTPGIAAYNLPAYVISVAPLATVTVPVTYSVNTSYNLSYTADAV